MKIVLIILGVLLYLIATFCILNYATRSKPSKPLLAVGGCSLRSCWPQR